MIGPENTLYRAALRAPARPGPDLGGPLVFAAASDLHGHHGTRGDEQRRRAFQYPCRPIGLKP